MNLTDYKLLWATNCEPSNLTGQEALIYQLIAESANDSNSSKFREDVTKLLLGMEVSEGKHGYDDDTLPIEVKPKNFTGKTKLNGGGQFNDFTWARDTKYAKDDATIIVSGFHYGRVVFIVEFKYSDIRSKIQTQLKKLLPNGDERNRYVRSASFSYLDWYKSNYKVRYISPNLDSYSESMPKKLFKIISNSG